MSSMLTWGSSISSGLRCPIQDQFVSGLLHLGCGQVSVFSKTLSQRRACIVVLNRVFVIFAMFRLWCVFWHKCKNTSHTISNFLLDPLNFWCFFALQAFEATSKYYTDVDILEFLDPCEVWSMQVFQFHASDQPVASIHPDKVPAHPVQVQDGSEMKDVVSTFWPYTPPTRPTRTTHDTHYSWQMMVEAEEIAEIENDIVDDIGEFWSEHDDPGDDEVEDLALAEAEALNFLENDEQKKKKKRKTSQSTPTTTNILEPSTSSTHPASTETQDEAHGGSIEVPEHPAEEHPMQGQERAKVGGRLPAEVVLTLPNGQISYYAAKDIFQCTCKKHPGCVLSRTARGRRKQGSLIAGRPVAFMASWLEMADNCDTKLQHWNKEAWHAQLTHASRLSWRQRISAMTLGPSLLQFERTPEPQEPDEPLTLVGYE